MLLVEKIGRLVLPSRIFLAEKSPLETKQNEEALFASTYYKAYIHVDKQSFELTRIKCLLDTDA